MKKRNWFTLIEILIALTVFAIGIFAILRLITQNLQSVDQTKTRNIATLLAKEWMWIIYNIRDSNLIKKLPRNCVLQNDFNTDNFNEIKNLEDVCWRYFSSWAEDGQVLQISFNPEKYFFTKVVQRSDLFSDNFANNKLFIHTWENIFWYSYDSQSSQATSFSRFIQFSSVKEKDKILPVDKILKVSSHVLFMRWSKTWEVVLESFIWSY